MYQRGVWRTALTASSLGLGFVCSTKKFPMNYATNDGAKPVAPPTAAGKVTLSDKQIKELIFDNISLLCGTASKELGQKIAGHLGTKLTDMEVVRFSDGEVSCVINESIRGKDVFIIQTCSQPVNDNIMELLLTITAARRSGANRIIAVVPYFAYKYHRRGLPISSLSHSRFLWSASNDLAKMLQTVGVDGVLSVDLQRPGQGHEASFFDSTVPVETLTSVNMFVSYFKDNIDLGDDVVIVSPNTECAKRARKFQKKLSAATGKAVGYASFIDAGTALSNTEDNKQGVATSTSELLGEVTGADVIVIDDVVETGETLISLCRKLIQQGAKRIYFCAPHGMFTQEALQLIDQAPVELVVVSDSVPLPKQHKSKIVQVSLAYDLARIIEKEALVVTTENHEQGKIMHVNSPEKSLEEEVEEYDLE